MFLTVRRVAALLSLFTLTARADSDVSLLEVPDYTWYAGCFGTACGNLMGYWDRHGLPDFYTGPTADGVAPLNTCGENIGIRSMWATKAGFDGRPSTMMGHIDDYWSAYSIDEPSCGRFDGFSYASTVPDPYITAGRKEHTPDCIADFVGLSQRKWTNMNNECDGNIDAYSFVYWDSTGNRRINYVPSSSAGSPARDIQSGLRQWAKYRGYDADVFTQLVDFNPQTPPGKGFTFEDLKAEIDTGYPVLVFLQDYDQFSRTIQGTPRVNPEIHGVLIYRYEESFGVNSVYLRTSWGSGDNYRRVWTAHPWFGELGPDLSVRGVIGFRPKPRLRSISRDGTTVTLTWDGPSSQVYDAWAGTTNTVHRYQVERSPTLTPPAWKPVGEPTTSLTTSFTACCDNSGFFRVSLLGPETNQN